MTTDILRIILSLLGGWVVGNVMKSKKIEIFSIRGATISIGVAIIYIMVLRFMFR